jgi:tetratricopeptide (TPR) repeat protein
MKRFFRVALAVMGSLAVCLTAAPRLLAQAPAAGDKAATGQSKQPDASQKPATPAPSSTNPFPEDTSTVPLMPSKGTPALPEGTFRGEDSTPVPLPGGDLDPVRSPDDPAPAATSEQGEDSSSSLKGMERLLPLPEDDQPDKKKKLFVKEPTHQEASSKDIEVGDYYLQTRNWKAALSRFESALVLDPENPEVYWGLAEAEHHLGDFADAKAHYLKLLDYDPDGPHGKQARNALKDPALVKAPDTSPGQPAASTPK